MRATLIALLVIAIGLLGYAGWRKITEARETRGDETEAPETAERPPLPLIQDGTRPVGPAVAPDANNAGDPDAAGEGSPAVARRPDEQTTQPATRNQPARTAELEQAMKLKAEGGPDNLHKAREILTRLLLTSPEGQGRENIRKTLDEINSTLFFSRGPSPDSERYIVQQGDSLWRVQNRVNRSWELIKLVNRMTNDNLRVNESLKIPAGDFTALVQKRQFRITIFLNGHYIKEYPIAIGQDGLTPTGEFTIKNKHREPSYTNPEGKFMAYGHPENPLGTRWLGFDDTPDRTGLGIHGTNDDTIIGKKATNGCIRLYNKDVEEVFGMLRTGDRVRVVE